MNIFTGDLYSMYVVLKGIASLPCIRVWCYIRNSRWGVATLDVWSSETRTFQQKNPGPPKWSISVYIVLKDVFFQAHRRVHPTTGVVYCIRILLMQRGCSLVFSSVPTLAFLFLLMLVWAAISYQVQKPIHRIWLNIIDSSMQWLPEIWQLMGLMGGTLLWTSNCILLL